MSGYTAHSPHGRVRSSVVRPSSARRRATVAMLAYSTPVLTRAVVSFVSTRAVLWRLGLAVVIHRIVEKAPGAFRCASKSRTGSGREAIRSDMVGSSSVRQSITTIDLHTHYASDSGRGKYWIRYSSKKFLSNICKFFLTCPNSMVHSGLPGRIRGLARTKKTKRPPPPFFFHGSPL